jgi:prepilin-type N-terminal cleavage/methylation domain-containing protein
MELSGRHIFENTVENDSQLRYSLSITRERQVYIAINPHFCGRGRKDMKRGFTLIELLVVVAVIAILTALVLPKLDGVQAQANHAVGAGSANDLGRYIQIYKAQKNRLPDGWDLLTNEANNALWAPANPATNTHGLHNNVSGTNVKFTLGAALVQGEVNALNSAGIYTGYGLSPDAAFAPNTSVAKPRPGDRYRVTTPLAVGQVVCVPNPATSGGAKIIDHIYRDNLKTGGTSGALPTGKRLIAFGFGPHNALVGKSMLEVPYYPNVDPTLVYNRNLVIFEVGTSGRAVFKAVVAADGDLLDDMAADISKDPQ